MFGRNKDEKSNVAKVERLYEKYKILMLREAYRILKDNSLAEDAVHQSFEKIIKNLDRIDEQEEAKARNYIMIICRHTAFDIYRNRTYLNQNAESLDYEIDDDSDSVLADYREPSKIVIDKETVNKVAEIIEKLPPIYRDVILLEKLHGNSKEEIADLLNINYETVRKRSLRARNMLAEALEKEEDLI
jgi:RNA polymerase sigma-70 factor (ECF subfamily)